MMKVFATKKLIKEKHKYSFKEILFCIGIAFMFLALGSAGLRTPLSMVLFGSEYSGSIILELLLAVILGIIALVNYDGRKIYIIIALVSFIIGALLTYSLVSVGLPGVDITDYLYS